MAEASLNDLFDEWWERSTKEQAMLTAGVRPAEMLPEDYRMVANILSTVLKNRKPQR